MLRVALVVLSCLPALASAVICKTIDEDGVVTYSSVPLAKCENVVRLPGYSSYAPQPVGRTSGGSANTSPPAFAGYTSIRFSQPASGATVRSNEGQVAVSVAVEPALQAGHRLELILDGRPVSGSFDGLNVQLSGVERGTHSLQAVIRDDAGTQRIRSSTIRFTLRKRGLFDGAAQPTPPDETPKPPPGFAASGQPADYSDGSPPDYGTPDADYTPDAPNYTPPANPITSTPGRTNPAFAPSYRP